MLSAAQGGSAWSTPSWQMRCGVMPASRCMQARRRSGTGQVSDQKLAISSSGDPTLQWNGRERSEEGWRQRRENAASRSCGHFSDIQSSWSTSCRPCVQQTLFDRIPSFPRRAIGVSLVVALRNSKSQLFHQSCSS